MSIILRQNEELIKVARKHIMFLLPVFFTWPFLIAGMILIRYALNFDFFGYWWLLLIVVFLIVVLVILYRYFLWKTDALIITNQRIVENEQRGFFSKTVTELLFQDILETSYSKEGLSASLYDYGNIKIRTAANNEIIFDKIAKPDETVELINRIRRKDERVILDEEINV
ncbi:MAG: PH domain-containing protein [Candidatus Yanofskybacteria bacterium]|nr:PH domain-containing protein [Candidatus Yanofskybacteria bacterium]